MPRRLLLLLAALTVLALTGLAGIATAAASGVGAQNRVRAFDETAPSLIGIRATESPCSRPSLIGSTAEVASGFCVAAEETVITGARGPSSGRLFDPGAAGGPIEQLDASTASITDEGVDAVEAHLSRFTGGGPIAAPEAAMLGRLRSIAGGDLSRTEFDQNFYTHELREADRYAAIGFGPESGANLGDSDMYDVWNNVHTATLEDYGISAGQLFYPGVGP